MFDNVNRCIWLQEQLWPKLRESFDCLTRIPAEVLITVGYPSSGARGRIEKIKPAEINYQWTGNENEKAFISVHPNHFTKPVDVAKAIVYQGSKVTIGHRWGPARVGLTLETDGTISAEPETQRKLDNIIADIGEPPVGMGVPFPVRTVQRTRMRKYVAFDSHCADGETPHPIIRAASDVLSVACQTCGSKYSIEK